MNYKKVELNDIEFLRELCSQERVYTGNQIEEDYSHDEMLEYGKFTPEILVEPISTKEISDILRYAYGKNIPVTPRGAGTGLCGGAVAIHGGILISLMKMNKILEIDEENFTATVEPGLLLMDLIKALNEKDLLYPPDPGEKSATLGGNVMTNAGGMRAVKYGVTREYIMGMEFVLANGDIINQGGKTAKNSSGYSIMNLLIGSEGTLGIVTKLILKLLPLPKKSVCLLVPFENLEECLKTVPLLIKSKTIPTAIEFMQRDVIELAEEFLDKKFPDKTADSYLLIAYNGNSESELEEKYMIASEICIDNNAIDVFVADKKDREETIWNTRGAFLEAIISSTPRLDECDVVVPINKISTFVTYIKEIEKNHDIRIRQFGHAGDGNLHMYVCKDKLSDIEWSERLDIVMKKMYKKAIELKGQVSGEHGIGHAKIAFLEESVGKKCMDLMWHIKMSFDPKNILNPGKIVKGRGVLNG
jgi:glycolate oxidase